jgi:hypothetical protein
MSYDPKLVETMCLAYWEASGGSQITWANLCEQSPHRAEDVRIGMMAVLDTINGSGLAWVAPWDGPFGAPYDWAELRDAYLAKQNTETKEKQP